MLEKRIMVSIEAAGARHKRRDLTCWQDWPSINQREMQSSAQFRMLLADLDRFVECRAYSHQARGAQAALGQAFDNSFVDAWMTAKIIGIQNNSFHDWLPRWCIVVVFIRLS